MCVAIVLRGKELQPAARAGRACRQQVILAVCCSWVVQSVSDLHVRCFLFWPSVKWDVELACVISANIKHNQREEKQLREKE